MTTVEFLFLRTDNPIVLRIDADEPFVVGSGGTYPTGFGGGETLTLDMHGTAVTVTFDALDQTVDDVVKRVNAALALAGLDNTASAENGQLRIDGTKTGPAEYIEVTGGSAAATLGFASVPLRAYGKGSDVPVHGLFLAEFGVPGAVVAPPKRIQASGSAGVTFVAAGRTTA